MRTRQLTLIPVVALAATLLSGCVFNVGLDTSPRVSPEQLADAAESALESTTGVRPEIDCGRTPVAVKINRSVTCLLLDPVAGLEFDVVVTFTGVTGDDFSFDVKVADVPNNATQPTAAPGATVPVGDIEALAIRALRPTLDFVPAVNCDATSVAIVVGTTVSCEYDSPGGPVAIVVVITAYDATAGTYSIRVDEV